MDRRGMLRAHTQWRPRPRDPGPPAVPWASGHAARARVFRVSLRRLAGAAVAGVLAVTVAVVLLSGGGASLPATPRAWLDAYEGAAIADPPDVCRVLFAPELAVAFGRTVRGGCGGYFARVSSSSVTVRRVLEDGGTAVLELRQKLTGADWDVVLARSGAGWQAVDLVPGKVLR